MSNSAVFCLHFVFEIFLIWLLVITAKEIKRLLQEINKQTKEQTQGNETLKVHVVKVRRHVSPIELEEVADEIIL